MSETVAIYVQRSQKRCGDRCALAAKVLEHAAQCVDAFHDYAGTTVTPQVPKRSSAAMSTAALLGPRAGYCSSSVPVRTVTKNVNILSSHAVMAEQY